jgi:hypothetical protein
MQDSSNYHSPSGYVYTTEYALELTAIWDGVDALERHGMPLQRIADALAANWESAVIALAKFGGRS